MDDSAIAISTVGPVRWLRLNRPAQLNALHPQLMAELERAVVDAEADPAVRVLVLTGAGRAFSAGGDLTHFRDRLAHGEFDRIADGVAQSAAALERLAACPKPVIAAVNGVAVAGGLEIILCCDLVVAVEGVLIGDGHLKFGVLPGGGGSVRLMRRIAPNVARRLLLTGALFRAEQFLDWGLVNEVVTADQLADRVQDLADSVAALSPLALAQVKGVANYALDAPIESALQLEQEVFASYVRSADFAEGVDAFANKRTPKFTGK